VGIPHTKMQGVWVIGLEESVFVENATERVQLKRSFQNAVWLDVDTAKAINRAGFALDGNERQFLVSFVGRKSTRHGLYGHHGMYEKGVVLDKLLSIRPLDTKAQ
jgi:hypothetical protein